MEKFKHKRLRPKDCPVCEKDIYDVKPVDGGRFKIVKNKNHKELWVRFNDGSNAQFSICKGCFVKLDQETADLIMRHQVYSWGCEIIEAPYSVNFGEQLKWYVNTAVHLKVVKWGATKSEVAPDNSQSEKPGGSQPIR